MESANVFTTKSVLVPIATMAVSKFALVVQDFVVLSSVEQESLVAFLVTASIIVVRLYTSRPSHIVKPKE